MKDSNSVERELRGNQTHFFIFQKEPEAWVGVEGWGVRGTIWVPLQLRTETS